MKTYFLFSLSILLIFCSCKKFVSPDPEWQVSKYSEDESHYEGKICADCHYSAGGGEGWFNLAGTAYGNTNMADIVLYSDTNSNPLTRVQFDMRGNAYTSESIDFSNGLYVGVENSNGHVEFMDGKIFSGQCNMCHGKDMGEDIIIK